MKATAIIFIIVSACLFVALVFVTRVPTIKLLIRNKGKLRRELTTIVSSIKDIPYESAFGDVSLDMYTPKNVCHPLPILLWVHGGGYVSGDKSGIEPWAHELIARVDIAVVCINYNLAPQSRYPVPLYQICEAVDYLRRHEREFSLHTDGIFIGGDSAGAQIAAQFASLYFDSELRNRLKIPTDSLKTIAGAVLCCGFYDLRSARTARFPAIRTFIGTYIGKTHDMFSSETDLFSRLNSGFCDTFVSCGTRDPFFTQSKRLATVLEEKNIAAEKFFPKEGHEFQFRIGSKNSTAAADRVAEFIRSRIEKTFHGGDEKLIGDIQFHGGDNELIEKAEDCTPNTPT